ncbi:13017_t:CDS:2 [Gigaspora margarita]|uniref:13017_t:CDS:1 n=1 Tax=Gigaspora margarita TaxID=4874 RepID=A0ABN7V003_GIGMA|nr:13017_t:CDS:2 [Gigaspora margarita]
MENKQGKKVKVYNTRAKVVAKKAARLQQKTESIEQEKVTECLSGTENVNKDFFPNSSTVANNVTRSKKEHSGKIYAIAEDIACLAVIIKLKSNKI